MASKRMVRGGECHTATRSPCSWKKCIATLMTLPSISLFWQLATQGIPDVPFPRNTFQFLLKALPGQMTSVSLPANSRSTSSS